MSNINLNTAKGLLAVGKRAVVNTYKVGTAIARAGDWVAFDTSKSGEARTEYVVPGGANGQTFGVALEAVSTVGAPIRVCVEGYVEGAQTDNSATAGSALVAKANAEVGNYANSDTLAPIGVALENDAGSDPYTCDVYVYRTIA